VPPRNSSYSQWILPPNTGYYIYMIYRTSTLTHNTTHDGHFNIMYMNNSTSLYIQKWVWVICWLLGCSCISQRSAEESTVPVTNCQCQGLWDMSNYEAPVTSVGWKPTTSGFISHKMKTNHTGMCTSCRPTQLSADVLRKDGDQKMTYDPTYY